MFLHKIRWKMDQRDLKRQKNSVVGPNIPAFLLELGGLLLPFSGTFGGPAYRKNMPNSTWGTHLHGFVNLVLCISSFDRFVETWALNKRCWMSQNTRCLGSLVPLAKFYLRMIWSRTCWRWSSLGKIRTDITKIYKYLKILGQSRPTAGKA